MLFGKIVDINSIEKRVRQSAANMGISAKSSVKSSVNSWVMSFYSTKASGRATDSSGRRSAAMAYRQAIAAAATINTDPSR